jgi:hypothetical protein
VKLTSTECHREDYKIHKQFCAIANDFRPSPNHVRALWFPGEDKPAELVWLEIATTGLKTFDQDKFFPQGLDRFQSIRNWLQDGKYYELGPNAKDGRGECLDIYMSHWVYDLPPNQTVRQFSTKKRVADNMRGPILVIRRTLMSEQYRGIEMRHIRHAADCFSVAFLPEDPTRKYDSPYAHLLARS